ncbi:hypothetical protein L5515_013925 [Caenorhabditis briggsae]|uniref:Uncharacterized protein n=1 Tax=Caenorhabditis briggsae TaxID=6238 RepID=A0AAE9E9N3_CAEBR|nr:hypothetical protein L5515_013925 [Caenorhabditis briggsae]
MLTTNGPRSNKISRDISNFIVTEVLQRSDDLIKNSYRRLTTENVARNEHWSRIAENVMEKFDVPTEMERVKSHFHNRKKVLLARVKDELKLIPNSNLMTTDQKVDELILRRVVVGKYDEQLAKVCLDIEEEEKLRTEQFGNDHMMQPMVNLFTETSHQSLLSQLLSTSSSYSAVERSSSTSSPRESSSSKDMDVPASVPAPVSTRSPLLSKLLSDPSTSKENGHSQGQISHNRKTIRLPMEMKAPQTRYTDHTYPAEAPKINQYSALPSPAEQYLSHVIVDISSPDELKKLLSVLIDNGFSQFHHVTNSDMASTSIGTGINRALSLRPQVKRSQNNIPSEHIIEKQENTIWPVQVTHHEQRSCTPDTSIMRSIKSRVERVDVEIKAEPITEYEDDECGEDDVDEQTAQLEAQLASEALKTGLALFDKGPPSKKMRTSSFSENGTSDIVTANCEMCASVIRLNSGQSKWNLYEHVMMKHSIHKPFKCPLCPYQAGRKLRVKQHSLSQHYTETEPIDMITPEVRSEWLKTMSRCFPAHQYQRISHT